MGLNKLQARVSIGVVLNKHGPDVAKIYQDIIQADKKTPLKAYQELESFYSSTLIRSEYLNSWVKLRLSRLWRSMRN